MFNKKCRLILTVLSDAKTNMAIDNALAFCYKKNDLPVFRIYTWKKSFTLGISQSIENYKQLRDEYKSNFSKRITGGGVIFHGHDISYSLVLPSSYFKTSNIKQSYEKICKFLLNFYKQLGLNSCFAKDMSDIKLSKSEYCQVGFEAYDIVVNKIKIGGNAQKRSKDMIFQHGSIPIKKTIHDDKLGLCLEDFDINMSFEEATEKLIESFEKSFETKLILSELSEIEKEKFNEIILKEKNGNSY